MPNYIYALNCPIANDVRYIGKTVNPGKRLKSHISAAKNFAYKHHTSAWIRKLLTQGLTPSMQILEEVAEGTRWQDAEKEWIVKARKLGWKLTNSTSGGEGLDYICPSAAEAYRKNLSAAMAQLWNLPERREEARRRSNAAWADPDITARRKASMSAAQSTPEYREKNLAALAEIKERPEVKAKKAAAARANFAGSGLEKCVKSEEFKNAQGQRLAGRWKDPEAKAKMHKARWTDEHRAAQAAAILARKDKIAAAMTPEVRAAQGLKMKAYHARKKAAKLALMTAEQIQEEIAEKKAKRAAYAKKVNEAKKAEKLAALSQTPT